MIDLDEILTALVIFLVMFVCAVGIIHFEDKHEQAVRDTMTISEYCLKNDFYVIDNLCDKSCHVNIDCHGKVEDILIIGNRFTCDGEINLIFSNATKILVSGNVIGHDIKFQNIDEFEFTDTPTMDKITVRGSS